MTLCRAVKSCTWTKLVSFHSQNSVAMQHSFLSGRLEMHPAAYMDIPSLIQPSVHTSMSPSYNLTVTPKHSILRPLRHTLLAHPLHPLAASTPVTFFPTTPRAASTAKLAVALTADASRLTAPSTALLMISPGRAVSLSDATAVPFPEDDDAEYELEM